MTDTPNTVNFESYTPTTEYQVFADDIMRLYNILETQDTDSISEIIITIDQFEKYLKSQIKGIELSPLTEANDIKKSPIALFDGLKSSFKAQNECNRVLIIATKIIIDQFKNNPAVFKKGFVLRNPASLHPKLIGKTGVTSANCIKTFKVAEAFINYMLQRELNEDQLNIDIKPVITTVSSSRRESVVLNPQEKIKSYIIFEGYDKGAKIIQLEKKLVQKLSRDDYFKDRWQAIEAARNIHELMKLIIAESSQKKIYENGSLILNERVILEIRNLFTPDVTIRSKGSIENQHKVYNFINKCFEEMINGGW